MCKLGDGDENNSRWDVGMNILGEKEVAESMYLRFSHARMKLWSLRLFTTLLIWTSIIQLVAVGEVWGPRLLKSWPSCSNPPPIMHAATNNVSSFQPKRPHLPPKSEFLLPFLCVLFYVLLALLSFLIEVHFYFMNL